MMLSFHVHIHESVLKRIFSHPIRVGYGTLQNPEGHGGIGLNTSLRE